MFENYEKIEKRHTTVTTTFIRAGCIIMGLSYPIPALYPVFFTVHEYSQLSKLLAFGSRFVFNSAMLSSFSVESYIYVKCKIFLCCSAPPLELVPNIILRFYANCFIQMCTSSGFFIFAVASMSFYIGVCLYIKGMTEDLQRKLEKYSEATSNQQFKRSALILNDSYFEEIKFHGEILE